MIGDSTDLFGNTAEPTDPANIFEPSGFKLVGTVIELRTLQLNVIHY